MALTSKVASKKGERSQYNMGDEGFYEDDGAGVDYDYYLDLMNKTPEGEAPKDKGEKKKKKKDKKDKPSGPPKPDFSQIKDEAKRKAAILEWEESERMRLKEKKKAEKLRKQIESEEKEKLAKEKEERDRMRKYLKSSAYKRDCWIKKRKERFDLEKEWNPIEEEHARKCEEYRLEKARWERQQKIDISWTQPESQTTSNAPAKPSGKKPGGKGGKKIDPRMYFGEGVQLPKQTEVEVTEKNIPWDPEQGDKDPNRPAELKREEKAQWEKTQKAWKKYIEDWNKTLNAHNKEVQRLKELGLYDSEPEFKTDTESEESSDSSSSDSDSD